MSGSGPTRYACGLPHIGPRKLEEVEIAAAHGRLRRLLRAARWSAVGCVLAASALVALAIAGVLARGVVAAIAIAGIVAAATAWSRIRVVARAREIAADLERGEVDCYGTPPGAGISEASIGPTLEVLPGSAMVLRRSSARRRGRLPSPWRMVHVAHVAPARPHAFRTDLPAGVVAESAEPGLRLQRRSLSPDERAEIDRHIRRLRARIWPPVAATVALAIATLWRTGEVGGVSELFAGGATGGPPYGWLGWLGWAALAVFAYIGYVRRVLAARRLEWDRRLRWVVTVDDEAPPESRSSGRPIPRLEVLPVSQLMWTENAAPAPWRTLRL